MRVKFDGGDLGSGIMVCDGQRLAAWGGAAVKNAGAVAYERGDKLRGFVLDDDLAAAECVGSGNVSSSDVAGRRQKVSGAQSHALLFQLPLGSGLAQPNCSVRNGLVVL